jgi:hypothetical protein
MVKIGKLMVIVPALSLILAASAFAQYQERDGRYQGMDRRDYNYQYQMEDRGTSDARSQAGQPYMGREADRYYGEPTARGYYPPADTFVESYMPPPTQSDIASERKNRKNTAPAKVYRETDQGIPTPGTPGLSSR